MPYSEKVLDHYENPRNVGSFPKDQLNIGTGMVGAPACGDVMKLQIQVDGDIMISQLNLHYPQSKYIVLFLQKMPSSQQSLIIKKTTKNFCKFL